MGLSGVIVGTGAVVVVVFLKSVSEAMACTGSTIMVTVVSAVLWLLAVLMGWSEVDGKVVKSAGVGKVVDVSGEEKSACLALRDQARRQERGLSSRETTLTLSHRSLHSQSKVAQGCAWEGARGDMPGEPGNLRNTVEPVAECVQALPPPAIWPAALA